MLRKAAAARYGCRSVNDVPDEYRAKYLIEDGDEYVVRRRTASLVQTVHLNLHDRMAMRAMRGFDFIFCRNVLMYLEACHRYAVVAGLASLVAPDGLLILDPTEHLGKAGHLFTPGADAVYRRLGTSCRPAQRN